ncbi:MAG: DnaD domain protein [Paenibacillus sp.]|jgi:DNA replication protein|nr:DnaD domain protein [Paenibacillus sp.]
MAYGEELATNERGIAAALQTGSLSVPVLLLQLYKKMKLSDMEVMLLIQLMVYKEKEGVEFPTPDELKGRMSADADAVIKALQRLLKEGFMQIDEDIDSETGVMSEAYNLTPLYGKLAAAWTDERTKPKEQPAAARRGPQAVKSEAADIFSMFEKEFARPLTPMECETVSQWIDRDRYPQELILFALKEAVFAGVVHFRYIDRILLEWSRNRVQTPEQAKQYTQKFRGSR